jgi:hypothetical protein
MHPDPAPEIKAPRNKMQEKFRKKLMMQTKTFDFPTL